MPQDEENEDLEDDLDQELEEEAEQIKKKPSKKASVAEPKEEEQEAGERYQAFVIPERFGIMDTVTNEPVVEAAKAPTITEMEGITLQAEAKAMNDRDKIMVSGGFN